MINICLRVFCLNKEALQRIVYKYLTFIGLLLGLSS